MENEPPAVTDKAFPPFTLLFYGADNCYQDDTAKEQYRRFRLHVTEVLRGVLKDDYSTQIASFMNRGKVAIHNSRNFEYHEGQGLSFINPDMVAGDLELAPGIRRKASQAIVEFARRSAETISYGAGEYVPAGDRPSDASQISNTSD